MKTKKIIVCILSVIAAFCFGLFVAGCGNNNSETVDDFGNNNIIVAQVGYDFTIPVPNNLSEYVSVSIIDKEGKELSVSNGKVHFDKSGEYAVKYSDGKSAYVGKIVVCDTEAPRFDAFWEGLWQNNRYMEDPDQIGGFIRLFGNVGEVYDLSETFHAKDNGGECSVSFEVKKGGVDVVALTDGTKFNVEKTDYYTVTAIAKDPAGNIGRVSYKMYPEFIGKFMNFDFREEGYIKYAVINGVDNATASQLRKDMTLSDFSFSGRSLKVPIKSGYGVVNLLLENSSIAFSNIYSISYKIYIDSGANKYTLTGAEMPNVSNGNNVTESISTNEWSEITVLNSTITGASLGINIPDYSAKFGGDYNVYIDEIFLEYYPEIVLDSNYAMAKIGVETTLEDLGIKIKDINKGEITYSFVITNRNSGSVVESIGNKFTLPAKGLYSLTVDVVKNGVINVSKEFLLVGYENIDDFSEEELFSNPANFGADYVYFNTAASNVWSSIKIDTEFEENTIVNVRFKVKTDVIGIWTTLFMPYSAGTVLEPTNVATGVPGIYSKGFGEYRDWTEVSYSKALVTSGQSAYDHITAWSQDAKNTLIADADQVGIFVMIPNQNPGSIVLIKDVVIEKEGTLKPDEGFEDADYTVVNKQGYYYTAIKLPTDVPVGGAVKITYKVKTNCPQGYSGIFWVGSNGALGLDANIYPNMQNCTEWTDCEATVQVTTGLTARNVLDDWSTDNIAALGMLIDLEDTGAFLMFVNHTSGTIGLKDVVIEPVS